MEHLIVSSQHYLIADIYRPPDRADLNDKFKDILEKIWIKQKNIILLGDLNSDLLFKGNLPSQIYYGKRLLKVINQLSLKNIIKAPTRIDDITETIIDVIIVSNTDKILTSGTFQQAISDHKLVYAVLNIKRDNPRPTIKTVRDYKSLNQDQLKTSFEQTPWWITNFFDEVEDTVNIFELMYKDVIKEYVKTRTAKVKTKSLPSVTRKIRKLMNKRYKALSKWQ